MDIKLKSPRTSDAGPAYEGLFPCKITKKIGLIPLLLSALIIMFHPSHSQDDSDCDLILDPDNENQYIVWSIGGLGETAFRHFKNAPSDSAPLHFGRTPSNDCPSEPLVCNECGPFEGATIVALDDTHFTAQIGNPGQERGYLGITGELYSWTHTHTCTHSLMCTCTHTCTHSLMCTCTHTCTLTHSLAHTYVQTHALTHTPHAHTHTHMYTHHTHTHTLTCTHTTRTHTHTGQAGWGYSWYINNILVPELMVQRGKTYTFTVEGGDDPVISGQYHPFYITDSRNGGRLLNEDDQREVRY